MKNIANFLTESFNTYLRLSKHYPWNNSKSFLMISIDGEYGFFDDSDISDYIIENRLDSEEENDIFALKPGELHMTYDGKCSFIRIKK